METYTLLNCLNGEVDSLFTFRGLIDTRAILSITGYLNDWVGIPLKTVSRIDGNIHII